MHNLIDFFKKYFHIFIFLFLQIVCLVLISNNLSYPRFKMGKLARHVTYPVHKMWGGVLQHFNYNAENKALVEQNLALIRERDNSFLFISDSVYEKNTGEGKKKVRLYDYISANVVYNTVHKAYNYIIIDRGADDGVELDMAVFSAQGVVGLVNEVSKNFSTVMSILHPDVRISAKLMPSNQLGTVIWQGNSATVAYLHDIPQHTTANIGDSVFTSGLSNVFPGDILIGIVLEKELNRDNSFFTVKIRLATDMNKINTVYVVKNLYKEELEQLKSNFKDE